MCRCKYPKSISKKGINIIEDKEGNRCYKVSFDLGGEGSKVLIISRAPKAVEDISCDGFYKRIVRFLDRNKNIFKGIINITVVNLFTPYELNKGYLYNEYILRGEDYISGNEENNYNDSVIADEINKADFIIPAWGDPIEGLNEEYAKRVEFILITIREAILNSLEKKSVVKVGGLSKKGYPRHCLAWSYNNSVQNFFE